jgi:hypothetical protein
MFTTNDRVFNMLQLDRHLEERDITLNDPDDPASKIEIYVGQYSNQFDNYKYMFVFQTFKAD